MQAVRIIFKIVMWVLIVGFLSNFVMRTVSYSFYKGNKKKDTVHVVPQKINYTDTLTGYGYNLHSESNAVILCFGGSVYVAYNTVGIFAAPYDVPFLSVDYYGTQASGGKMNLKTMQLSAEQLYDWAKKQYPVRKIIVVGHSYGCGMAAYLASVRPCDQLFLLSGYRDLADLYNKMAPIFWGPLKAFISDNITVHEYAKQTTCPVTIIGSDTDKTLSPDLQKKLANCYEKAELIIFPDIQHEDYLTDERVISQIKKTLE
ncbi:MAG: alpha/beta fold hydrolase [Christensenellales bacterium]|jgi:pimeloyl-ACP methyl ester carboxylesterase